MLLSIYFALGALYEYSAKKQVLSALAYLISIMNMEQAVLTPVVIFLMSFLRVRGIRLSFAGTVKTVWPHFLILGVYGAFILFWKGLPTEGVSRFEYGTNVVHNIIVYLGATYDFWPILSNFIPNLGFDLVPSHLILAAFVIYLIIGRSFRELAFALVFLFFMLLPMLFLYGHFFYYHMYIASFGPLFLLALVLEDLLIPLKRQGLNTPQRRLLAACILVLAVAPFSYFKIRENISLALNEETRMQGSFVLRRSVFARNIFDNLEKKSGDMNNVRNIHMVHIKPGLDRIKPGDTEIRVGGLDREMYWALARGNVARVYFHKYDVDVTMESDFDPDAYQKGPDGRTRVFFYDEYGGIYTPEELMKTLEKYKAQYGGDQPGITVKSYQGKDEIEE